MASMTRRIFDANFSPPHFFLFFTLKVVMILQSCKVILLIYLFFNFIFLYFIFYDFFFNGYGSIEFLIFHG
jgi:hypothetical protein